MKTEYWQRGESIDYINTGADDIEAGDVVSLTTRVGVAGCGIPVGGVGSLHVTGVFIMPKGNAAISLGAAVNYDAAAEQIVTTTGVPAGWAVEAASASATTVKVKIG